MAAPRPLQGAHARAAGRRPRRQRRPTKRELRDAARQGAGARQGRDAPADAARPACAARCSPARRRARSARSRCSRPSAPARSAAPATPSSTRACSATTASTAGAPTCVGTGLKLTREQRKAYDDSVPRRRRQGPRAELPGRGGRGRRRRRRAVPRLRRHAPEPGLARGHVRGRVDRLDRAVVGAATRGKWVEALALAGRDAEIARDVVTEIRSRLEFLEEVGLGYLTLDRAAPTLSRRRGAAHPPRGAARQQPAGRVLRARRADHRPAPARQPDPARTRCTSSATRATRWWWSSTTRTRSAAPTTSSTSAPAPASAAAGWWPRAASSELVVERRFGDRPLPRASAACIRCSRAAPVAPATAATERKESASNALLTIRGATLHNLQDVTVDVPLQAPGRGHRRQRLGQVHAGARRAAGQPAGCRQQRARPREPTLAAAARAIDGWRLRSTACSKSTRRRSARRRAPARPPTSASGTRSASCSPTRWRRKARGYAPARFSFNTGEGRCPACEGQGVRTIEMSFLPDVKVPCDVCHGAALQPRDAGGELARQEHRRRAADGGRRGGRLLRRACPTSRHPLQLLKDVGLGYLTLGQPSPTLSGGEAQRIKLVTELSKVRDDISGAARRRRTRCTCSTSRRWACTWPTWRS